MWWFRRWYWRLRAAVTEMFLVSLWTVADTDDCDGFIEHAHAVTVCDGELVVWRGDLELVRVPLEQVAGLLITAV